MGAPNYTETPRLDRLPEIGIRAPWMCPQGWRSHLLQAAPGFIFGRSIRALCVPDTSVELALIFYHDGRSVFVA